MAFECNDFGIEQKPWIAFNLVTLHDIQSLNSFFCIMCKKHQTNMIKIFLIDENAKTNYKKYN
jgi:hypothetical protein